MSITTAPLFSASGAHLVLISPPAEKRAISTPSKQPSFNSLTIYFWPSYSISLPALLEDANKVNSFIGKLYSFKTFKKVEPTKPVAPTTATAMVSDIIRINNKISPYYFENNNKFNVSNRFDDSKYYVYDGVKGKIIDKMDNVNNYKFVARIF